MQPPASPAAGTIDRLAMLERPSGTPVMYQTWRKLLFMHWPMPVEQLRPHVPSSLEIDTFDGVAWIGVTPFTIDGIRPPGLPALPWASSSHEINVRTYVHREGQPGVWFFSLDASNLLAVCAARLGFSLPYFLARMRLHGDRTTIGMRSQRRGAGAGQGAFDAVWTVGDPLPQAEPGTRDFFLIERYCLYATSGARLYQSRIHHQRWPLCEAQLSLFQSTLLQADRLPLPTGRPLLHAQAEPLRVAIWPPRRLE